MRKTLAIVLSLLMVVSLLCLGVSAAEGAAIKTAAEFAAMTADGTYYLDADITISASYANKFTGVLDGNNHTVTVSAPMFTEFSGTLKNLKIQGSVTVTGAEDKAANYAGAVAKIVPDYGFFWLENITNNANVTGESTRVAGLIGETGMDCTYGILINCVNNGNITGTNETGDNMAGGLIGFCIGKATTINGCVNNGEITLTKGISGGLIGTIGLDKDAFAEAKVHNFFNCLNTGKVTGSTYVGGLLGYSRGVLVNMTNCTNKGEILSTESCAGGIAGRGGLKSYLTTYNFVKCLNEGKVTCNGGTVDETTLLPTSGTNCAGGIVGYVYGSKTTGLVNIDSCVNLGEISCPAFASQFIGYCNNKLDTIKNSYGGGLLTAGAKVITGLSSVVPGDMVGMENNQLGGLDNTEYYSYATAAENEANRVKLEDYLTISGIQPNAFTRVSTDPSLNGIGYDEAASLPTVVTTLAPETTKKAVTTKKPTTTKDPATTAAPVTSSASDVTNAPETTEAKKSGCGSVAAIGVAVIVTVIGAAVVRKKED